MNTNHGYRIDLRSDTVTKPTLAMRKAMAEAEVGDDVYGEDPTVNQLEALAAQMLDKEAAVYVSSGTMGNLLSVLSHCGRGDEIILGDKSHIFRSEQGGAAALGGIQPYTVPNQPDGTLDLAQIEQAIRQDNEHYPVTKLVCVENTQNMCGGRVLPVQYMDDVGDLAHRHGLQLHVDGARLFNAAVALNVSPARLVRNSDSISICLSKGLGAPVGSVVVGSQEFIKRARRNRKVVGGGMRQAGIIAAAGVVALTDMVERLVDDHANAKALAHGLAQTAGVRINPDDVETNLVFMELTHEHITATQLAAGLAQQGILIHPVGAKRARMVINHHISADDVATVVNAVRDVLANGATASGAKVTEGYR